MTARYADRRHAGVVLADRLRSRIDDPSGAVVLGLPRGGVPVAFEVARALGTTLDVFVVRKLGVPGHEELAMGALASGGTMVVNEELVRSLGISAAAVTATVERERQELERREDAYRDGRAVPDLRGKTVILVDDGLATGSTMRAAAMAVRGAAPARVVIAVPVGAPSTCEELRALADDVVCPLTPSSFAAVGQWYDDFSQTTDDEVRELLALAGTVERSITAPAAGVRLAGDLAIPHAPIGVVLFAHGSGSSRHSARNRRVAGALQDAGIATFLVDLLTAEEEVVDERTRELRFDIELLAERLVALTTWLHAHPTTAGIPIGLFGASTGGGAALVAAARRPDLVDAVVSRGGRPDLAGSALGAVRAPTLLIVGGRDDLVLELNRSALEQLDCERELVVVPEATHLFEEPGALEEVSRLARDWFVGHFRRGSSPSG